VPQKRSKKNPTQAPVWRKRIVEQLILLARAILAKLTVDGIKELVDWLHHYVG
jgi:hypothetical protein